MAGRDLGVRLLYKAVVHARALNVILVGLGLVCTCLLPLVQRKNFFDENALLVDGARATWRSATQLPEHERNLRALLADGAHPATFLQEYAASNASVSLQTEPPLVRAFSHFSRHTFRPPGSPHTCTNLHAVVPSPRGDGSEGMILVTPVSTSCAHIPSAHPDKPHSAGEGRPDKGHLSRGHHGDTLARGQDTSACMQQTAAGAAAALAVGLGLAQQLGSVPWLAKDFVWVIPDARCGLVPSAAAWIERYQGDSKQAPLDAAPFERAGTLQQAVVLEMADGKWDRVEVTGEGFDGQLPKLDLFLLAAHTFHRIAPSPPALPGPTHFTLDHFTLPPPLQTFLQTQLNQLSRAHRSLLDALVRLAAFVGRQALGKPTGAHAPFKDFFVDAVTVRLTLSEV